MSDRRPRKKNFTHDEVIILITKYKENKSALESKFNTFTTNKIKQQIWEEITEAVNAKGVVLREAKDVRKKWSDLKIQETEDFPKSVSTGGGPKEDIGPYSSLVLDILGEDSPCLIGVEGGGVESGVSVKETPTPPLEDCPPSPGPSHQPVQSPTPEPAITGSGSGSEPQLLPPPSKRLKRPREGKEDLDILRHELISVEIEKVKEEILKIRAEKEKIDLEKYKLNLEILKLQEELKAHGYTTLEL
jgi:hypothetical protein